MSWSKRNFWLSIILLLTGFLLFLQYSRKNTKYEGFEQREPYSIRRGSDIYDDFYVEIYDRLYTTESRSEYEATKIVDATQPDKDNSIFLDVGCGTGHLVNELKTRGFTAVGIDKSSAMIELGKEHRPDSCAQNKVADALDPMVFERGVFSHILCMNQTIYEIEDRVAFFRNCKHWLRPGGYLFVHVVEPTKFNPIVPLGQPRLLDGQIVDRTTGNRVSDVLLDFIDFKYKSSYDFSKMSEKGDGRIVQMETFTDSTTNKIRQNERVLNMVSPDTIFNDAQYCGFVGMGEFVGQRDKHQKVFILKAL